MPQKAAPKLADPQPIVQDNVPHAVSVASAWRLLADSRKVTVEFDRGNTSYILTIQAGNGIDLTLREKKKGKTWKPAIFFAAMRYSLDAGRRPWEKANSFFTISNEEIERALRFDPPGDFIYCDILPDDLVVQTKGEKR